MTIEHFRKTMQPVIDLVGGNPLDEALADRLNAAFPPGSPAFQAIEKACHEAMAEGWMCAEGAPGRRFGRVVEPEPGTADLSIDVVELADIVGPHHRHPAGEICLTMPVTPGATFDGQGAGWCVNPPGSAHFPTVRGGTALVLYLLPGGKIEFTGRKPEKA